MKHKLKLATLVAALLSTSAIAGLKELTIHSRANCGNNESITWHAGHTYTLLTVSDHIRNNMILHRLGSGWEDTWRSANVHWGEAGPGAGWSVQAGHYQRFGMQEFRLGFTTASDCSIYDGWWD